MTAHVHDQATHGPASDGQPPGRAAANPTRPRWLLPGIVGAVVVGALVVGGVIPLNAVLYAGLFGGMLLMHGGGHGHGHGGNANTGHGAHGSPPGDATAGDLSRRSSGAQGATSGSEMEPHDGAVDRSTAGETKHDDQQDQNRSRSCH